MKKILSVLVIIIFFMLIPLPIVQPTQVSSQAEGNSVCIIGEPNVSQFPEVQLDVRALDARMTPVKAIPQANFSIREEGDQYQLSRLVFNDKGAGLNLYFVFDRGKYTDIGTVQGLINRFIEQFGVDGLDQVTIIMADNTGSNVILDKSTNFSAIKAPMSEISSRLTVDSSPLNAVSMALEDIRASGRGCTQPSAVVVISGNISFSFGNPEVVNGLVSTANTIGTQIHVVQTSDQAAAFGFFSQLVDGTGGSISRPAGSLGAGSSELDGSLFSKLTDLRGTYTLSYRTTSGASGTRNLTVLLNGVASAAETQSSRYAVDLQPATVTLQAPLEGADVIRTAVTFLDPGFVFDNDIVPIDFSVDWPDGINRIPSQIRVIGITSNREVTIQDFSGSEPNRSSYHADWDIKDLTSEGDNPLGIRVEITDELGVRTVTSPINFNLRNVIPEAVAKQTTEQINKNLRITQYLVYALAGLIALAIALIIIFRKKIKQAFSSSGKIGMAIETVRKTIVGGTGRRKNPIAKLEILRPTVEVKSIFTESIKLGRDPNISDYTFFSLNSECSVSGEHAHLVKKRDGWKIIAVSASGSPVFVDEQRINMHEEFPLKGGQLVELGYQDLGSALFRFVEVETSEKFDFAQDAEFKPEKSVPDAEGYRKTQVLIVDNPDQEPTALGGVTQTVVDDGAFGTLSNEPDDFDSLFEDLREN
jgi:hypothetical protein